MGQELERLIKKYEGLKLKAYLCPAGVPTIGYGSTGPDIKLGMQWTVAESTERMKYDARKYLAATKSLTPNVHGDSLDAISDFTYNLGATRLKGSTLRKKLLAGDVEGAKRELLKWVRGGNRILPGLVRRRSEESELLHQEDLA